MLSLFDGVIDSYEATPGRGVPIGNLTSQFFANRYLAVLDHYVQDTTTRVCGARRKRPGGWNPCWRSCAVQVHWKIDGERWRSRGFVQSRLEPRESRQQLEQRREELPVGEPEQERAGEPEQQFGFRVALSSLDSERIHRTGQGPVLCPSGRASPRLAIQYRRDWAT